ncbi:hypothetical protein AWB77_03843 [Caballeronia fortuita]|uniref:Uncharacterized protein n=1 Tax=Caballeronia fortuita TaxID=1777138 RepID=A0A158C9U6_9BURK|nr:hypothetical protein AWB77_03843 [Caballeronia fortuita]
MRYIGTTPYVNASKDWTDIAHKHGVNRFVDEQRGLCC